MADPIRHLSEMKAGIVSKIKPVAICVVFLCGIAIPAPADIITVTNTNDSGPGSLRQALADAHGGDTITFAVTGTIGLTSGELVVNNNITISGPGAANLAINGNAISRVFHIASGRTATIFGLTITNGHVASGGGGGIYNDHATLTLDNCRITDNTAGSAGGGGIFNDGSNGSASLIITATMLVKNSTSSGGAIFNGGSVGTAMLELTSSVLSANSANNSGGAIFNLAGNAGNGGAAVAHITNSTISNNSASDGAGIYSSDNFDIHASVDVQITSSTLSGNSANGDGGGGFSLATAGNANLRISNSTVSGNSAGHNGGGVSNGGAPATGTLDIENATFFDNSAQSSGGSIYNSGFFGAGGMSHLANTVLKAGAAGGTIFNDGGTVTSLGYNLSSDNGGGYLTGPGDQINTDPMLGPLQDNGGPTLTHALLPGSPAIDTGDPSFTGPPFYDQRGVGFDRVVNGRVDKGSFEVQGPAPTPTVTPTVTPTPTLTPTSTPTATATPTPTPTPTATSTPTPTPTPTPTSTPRPMPTPRGRPTPPPRPTL